MRLAHLSLLPVDCSLWLAFGLFCREGSVQVRQIGRPEGCHCTMCFVNYDALHPIIMFITDSYGSSAKQSHSRIPGPRKRRCSGPLGASPAQLGCKNTSTHIPSSKNTSTLDVLGSIENRTRWLQIRTFRSFILRALAISCQDRVFRQTLSGHGHTGPAYSYDVKLKNDV